ncbi:MAG: nucleoside triphosphate pyrophosphohydrolase, partial [Maricaulaceae bacterium]
IASERGDFAFADVAEAISDKMVRRHPHVFADAKINTADEQTLAWEDMKAKERAENASRAPERASVLDDVPLGLPALVRALKLQNRAARVGFDWPSTDEVLDKLVEEARELAAADDDDQDHLEEELGDFLFVAANLARHLKIDPENALRRANAKFVRRFQHIEARLAETGQAPEAVSLADMDALWDEAKTLEKANSD